MEIKRIKEKEVWEEFLSRCDEKTFLHSWNWGEFNKAMGNKIWRLGVIKEKEIIAAALIVKIKARRGTFLFCPHGPSVKSKAQSQKPEVLKELINHLKQIAKQEKASFIRISPIWERTKANSDILKNLGFRNSPIHMHAESTWQLDIRPEEEMLLKKMRKTTRYLIRKALREKDIKIYQSKEIKDIKIFDVLYQKTVDRHHFVPFSFSYLKNEFLAFESDDEIAVFIGKYKDEIIASAVIVFWQGIAFYHHGASFLKYPKIPVSYLLQWEIIKEARKRGCMLYNFWGIAPKSKPKHPWAGLTLFKTGFGGYRKEFVETQDLPLSWRYWLTFLIEKIRKKKRRL